MGDGARLPPRRSSTSDRNEPVEVQVGRVRHDVANVVTALEGLFAHLFGTPQDRDDHGVLGELRDELAFIRRLLWTAIGTLLLVLAGLVADFIYRR